MAAEQLGRRAELIETLWNVNSKWLCDVLRRDFELIETLWNVNH